MFLSAGGALELSFSSLRLQTSFSTTPRSLITCYSFQSPLLSKSHPFFQLRGFTSDPPKKIQSFLSKGRDAIAGLQENSKKAKEKSTSEEAMELEEFAEEWRRKKIGWLCKELPAHEPAPMIRLLNKQRKWIKQEDVHYIINHLLRLRENNISHRVASSSSSERNWSTYSFIHSIKRNRLNSKKADNLVFVHSNLRLTTHKENAYKKGEARHWDVEPERAKLEDSIAHFDALALDDGDHELPSDVEADPEAEPNIASTDSSGTFAASNLQQQNDDDFL